MGPTAAPAWHARLALSKLSSDGRFARHVRLERLRLLQVSRLLPVSFSAVQVRRVLTVALAHFALQASTRAKLERQSARRHALETPVRRKAATR